MCDWSLSKVVRVLSVERFGERQESLSGNFGLAQDPDEKWNQVLRLKMQKKLQLFKLHKSFIIKKRNNSKQVLENIDLIQIISAYCQISDQQSTKYLEFDKLASLAKVYMSIIKLTKRSGLIDLIFSTKVWTQNILNKDGPSVLSRLYGLFSERMSPAEGIEKSVNYSISDLVVLLIYFYSLVGEECFYGNEEEDRIKVWNFVYFFRVYKSYYSRDLRLETSHKWASIRVVSQRLTIQVRFGVFQQK